MLLRLITLSVLSVFAAAETVIDVVDGDTIVVDSVTGPTRVRLLYVDTPETSMNSHGNYMPEGEHATAFLRRILPAGTQVDLVGDAQDHYGRRLAVVILPDKTTVQEALIAAGWSPYWRKYDQAENPELHSRLVEAENKARMKKAGAWSTAEKWMVDKANERTATKKAISVSWGTGTSNGDSSLSPPTTTRSRPSTSELPVSAENPSAETPVYVHGYYRKDGTYVPPHTRSRPKK